MNLPDVRQASIDSKKRESLRASLSRSAVRVSEGNRRDIGVSSEIAVDAKIDGIAPGSGATGAEHLQTAADLSVVYEQKLKTGIDIDPELWDQLKHHDWRHLLRLRRAGWAGPQINYVLRPKVLPTIGQHYVAVDLNNNKALFDSAKQQSVTRQASPSVGR